MKAKRNIKPKQAQKTVKPSPKKTPLKKAKGIKRKKIEPIESHSEKRSDLTCILENSLSPKNSLLSSNWLFTKIRALFS